MTLSYDQRERLIKMHKDYCDAHWNSKGGCSNCKLYQTEDICILPRTDEKLKKLDEFFKRSDI